MAPLWSDCSVRLWSTVWELWALLSKPASEFMGWGKCLLKHADISGAGGPGSCLILLFPVLLFSFFFQVWMQSCPTWGMMWLITMPCPSISWYPARPTISTSPGMPNPRWAGRLLLWVLDSWAVLLGEYCYHLMAFFFAKISICKVQNPYLYDCRQ